MNWPSCQTGQGGVEWVGPSEEASFGETGESFITNYSSDEQRPSAKHKWLRWDQRWRLCHGNGPGLCGLQVHLNQTWIPPQRAFQSSQVDFAVVFFNSLRQMTVTMGNQLVECQECHNLYHQDCHKPQVTDKEVNDPRLVWYCARCTRQMKRMVRKANITVYHFCMANQFIIQLKITICLFTRPRNPHRNLPLRPHHQHLL